jgi:hypothetical protein
MRRIKTIGALALLVASATQSGADDDAPPLLPPAGIPRPAPSPPSAPSSPAPTPARAAPRETTTAPRSSTPPPAPAPVSATPPRSGIRPRTFLPRQNTPRRDAAPSESDSSPPPLVPPGALGNGPEPRTAPRPLILESAPVGESEAATTPKPRSGQRPRPSTESKDRAKEPAQTPSPSRFPRLFGRPPAPPASSGRSRNSTPPDDSITLEPRSDPAADAALKRRLESQAKVAVGNRARAIEVRVVDRKVHIQAKVDRFWNRRTVRHALETLPGLSGYKTTVDIDE